MGYREAAGETPEEKYQNSCFGCRLESTKPNSEEEIISDRESDMILSSVEAIRRKRDSGAGIDLNDISMLEWKLILIWDDLAESHERNLRLYAKALFESLAAKGV